MRIATPTPLKKTPSGRMAFDEILRNRIEGELQTGQGTVGIMFRLLFDGLAKG